MGYWLHRVCPVVRLARGERQMRADKGRPRPKVACVPSKEGLNNTQPGRQLLCVEFAGVIDATKKTRWPSKSPKFEQFSCR